MRDFVEEGSKIMCNWLFWGLGKRRESKMPEVLYLVDWEKRGGKMRKRNLLGRWREREDGAIILILGMLHLKHRWKILLQIYSVTSRFIKFRLKGRPEDNNWSLLKAQDLSQLMRWPYRASLLLHFTNFLYLITQIAKLLHSGSWPLLLLPPLVFSLFIASALHLPCDL